MKICIDAGHDGSEIGIRNPVARKLKAVSTTLFFLLFQNLERPEKRANAELQKKKLTKSTRMQ